jgi:GT2 family glycosyltransferase
MNEFNLKDVLLHSPSHVSGIMKKSIWANVGGFDKDFLKGREDWDFLIRVIAKGVKSYKIPQALLFYRISCNSRDISANNNYNIELQQLIFKKNINLYLKIYNTPISLLRDYKTINQLLHEEQEAKKKCLQHIVL